MPLVWKLIGGDWAIRSNTRGCVLFGFLEMCQQTFSWHPAVLVLSAASCFIFLGISCHISWGNFSQYFPFATFYFDFLWQRRRKNCSKRDFFFFFSLRKAITGTSGLLWYCLEGGNQRAGVVRFCLYCFFLWLLLSHAGSAPATWIYQAPSDCTYAVTVVGVQQLLCSIAGLDNPWLVQQGRIWSLSFSAFLWRKSQERASSNIVPKRKMNERPGYALGCCRNL